MRVHVVTVTVHVLAAIAILRGTVAADSNYREVGEAGQVSKIATDQLSDLI